MPLKYSVFTRSGGVDKDVSLIYYLLILFPDFLDKFIPDKELYNSILFNIWICVTHDKLEYYIYIVDLRYSHTSQDKIWN